MNEYTKIVVLCEDRQQEVFARHFLVACGIEKRRIYPDISPKGTGSGEGYVRNEYPRHVISYRRIKNQMNAALVVLTDADQLEVEERLRALASVLTSQGLPDRSPDERIGIFVPKRHIETWIYYLMGEEVNEEDVYPHFQEPSVCKSSVQELLPTSVINLCRTLRRLRCTVLVRNSNAFCSCILSNDSSSNEFVVTIIRPTKEAGGLP